MTAMRRCLTLRSLKSEGQKLQSSPSIIRHFSGPGSHTNVQQNSENSTTNDVATLYVHWPYCEKRCSYCNFNKYISHSVDHKRMRKCLVTETNTLLQLSQVKTIKSIFFGGGTPSLAEPATIQAVIETVAKAVHLPTNAEISLEVNPTPTESTNLSDFKDAGVNRVSIGLQALNNKDLEVLGRQHTAEDGLRCLNLAKRLFPGKTSADLIFGSPGQSTKQLVSEMKQLIEACDDHISLYQLTLERGTSLFKKVMDRELYMPSPDDMADFYEALVACLDDNDFSRYEVSNFARTKQAESSHNKSYWDGTQYIGVGPGAHGRFVPHQENQTQRTARIQTLEPDPWMFEVEQKGHATRKVQPLSQYQVLQEILYLGLRTKQGISEERWQAFSGGIPLEDVFGDTRMFKVLQSEGYLQPLCGSLRATARGLNLVDGITKELYVMLEKYWELHRENSL